MKMMPWGWLLAVYVPMIFVGFAFTLYQCVNIKRKKRSYSDSRPLEIEAYGTAFILGFLWPVSILAIGFFWLGRGIEKLWVHRHKAQIVAETMAKAEKNEKGWTPHPVQPSLPFTPSPYVPIPTGGASYPSITTTDTTTTTIAPTKT